MLHRVLVGLTGPHVAVAVQAQELVVAVLRLLHLLLHLVLYPVYALRLETAVRAALPTGDLVDDRLLYLLVGQLVEVATHIIIMQEDIKNQGELIGHGAEAKIFKHQR